MAEVLSQSQIDALLNAARNGEMDLAAKAESSSEKKYRKYDFYSPRKFTKDRLKMLSGVFENYTRIINSRINGLLHTTCEIEVESVEEQRYYEFSNALLEGDVLALADVALEGQVQPDETPVLFHFSTTLMLSMMDRLMGGDGDVDSRLPAGYNFTNLELRLYESIVKDLISVLGGSWENYIALDFKLRRVETNPTLVQLIGLDETVVIVGINIRFPNCSGRVDVCLPGMMLTNIFSRIVSLNQAGHGSGEDNSDEIMDILRDSTLEITAELGRTEVKLQDAYFLNIGDVIDLGHPKDEPIYLYIGGKPWFGGKLGVQNNSMAVKIGENYYNEGRRDEYADPGSGAAGRGRHGGADEGDPANQRLCHQYRAEGDHRAAFVLSALDADQRIPAGAGERHALGAGADTAPDRGSVRRLWQTVQKPKKQPLKSGETSEKRVMSFSATMQFPWRCCWPAFLYSS